MLNESNETHKEFMYYNEDGVFIGKSEGTAPDEDLFNSAYYVFDTDTDIIKNLDVINALHRRLESMRKTLTATPISDMSNIMELNRQIKMLEHNIYELEKCASNTQTKH